MSGRPVTGARALRDRPSFFLNTKGKTRFSMGFTKNTAAILDNEIAARQRSV
jgi:hypothetical protein